MKLLDETENDFVILDLKDSCSAEEHLTPCMVEVVAVAHPSCDSNDVELWCDAAEAYYRISLLTQDLCFGCGRLLEDCWIAGMVDDELSNSQ